MSEQVHSDMMQAWSDDLAALKAAEAERDMQRQRADVAETASRAWKATAKRYRRMLAIHRDRLRADLAAERAEKQRLVEALRTYGGHINIACHVVGLDHSCHCGLDALLAPGAVPAVTTAGVPLCKWCPAPVREHGDVCEPCQCAALAHSDLREGNRE